MSRSRAILLSGSLGLGHEMLVRSCAALLERSGWSVESLDCMSLLGRCCGAAGQRIFTRTVRALPGAYDALHFSHLRAGSRLARALDTSASARLTPALREVFAHHPPDLVLSVFATGASGAAKLRASGELHAPAVVLCTDVTLHRLWVQPGTDLFLSTSPAAGASVLRYLPRANVAVVPPPVRPAFYEAPGREKARAELGLPRDAPCALVIDSGWGFGPLDARVAALARAGIYVLAVAGRKCDVERRFRALAATDEHVLAFGFVDDVPLLMAAADVVVALPGATTCSEARVVGRPLLLLDSMPGHGRENLLHELELGDARAAGPAPGDLVESALALLEAPADHAPRERLPRWEPAFAEALARVGVDLHTGADPGTGADLGGGAKVDPPTRAVALGAPPEPLRPAGLSWAAPAGGTDGTCDAGGTRDAGDGRLSGLISAERC
ncbi:MAG TPA: glycosyltransferase [Acidimicrobiales bacterium]|nr:glycosyltransferase [Acidimicrobiales bacterium]